MQVMLCLHLNLAFGLDAPLQTIVAWTGQSVRGLPGHPGHSGPVAPERDEGEGKR